MPRFILLEHTGAPDDPAGRHHDLLLEDGAACRAWRLPALPQPGGVPVTAVELAPHRLAWLDHEAGEVSGGRGFARRIDSGRYEVIAAANTSAATLRVGLCGARFQGVLLLHADPEGWRVSLEPGGHGRRTEEPRGHPG